MNVKNREKIEVQLQHVIVCVVNNSIRNAK